MGEPHTSVPQRKSSPDWRGDFARAREQLSRQRSRLLGLVGRRIDSAWTAWFSGGHTAEYRDGNVPTVLVFDDGAQLEITWKAGDSLSIAWNTIDLTAPLSAFGSTSEFRSSVPALVAGVVGRTVTAIAVGERPYFTDLGEFDLLTNPPPVAAIAGWHVSGVWFETGASGLYIYNGVDEGALACEPNEPGLGTLAQTRGTINETRTTPLRVFIAPVD